MQIKAIEKVINIIHNIRANDCGADTPNIRIPGIVFLAGFIKNPWKIIITARRTPAPGIYLSRSHILGAVSGRP